ncbi:response regulator receiver protein [Chloroherpeton thalassium ATCC 35110]|uniref:Response regulator receiver protein n=1 Tax=Chloroherpeton thalassium (strain ATCC 35110 / GB-78) TaxID=517418 RepID=B3QUN6_CHLT3|nr:response regulator [Chloroherpeton thalassium]ACF12942.1 response regulator receiver protein [Chloroherpeton thalassium ATCC 35110]
MIRKVLLVDDDADIHLFMQAVLHTEWIVAHSVYSAKEALKEFQSREFDLIISDISMPEMNGYEMVQELGKSNFKVPPVLILSSLANTNLIMKCLAAGVADYIIKPAEPERIRKTVYGLLLLDKNGQPISQRSLSSYMGEMTMMKSTGKLLLDDGKHTGEMRYENGKLKEIKFGPLTGLNALEAAKQSKFLQVTFIEGDFIIGSS